MIKNAMKVVLGLSIASLSVLGLSGCSVSVEGEDYQSIAPTFNIEQFFDGNVKAWGIVQNRSGEVVQRFVVDIDGSINGNTLTMTPRTDADGVKLTPIHSRRHLERRPAE